MRLKRLRGQILAGKHFNCFSLREKFILVSGKLNLFSTILILVILFILLPFKSEINLKEQRFFVNAGLIQIYHKYKPTGTISAQQQTSLNSNNLFENNILNLSSSPTSNAFDSLPSGLGDILSAGSGTDEERATTTTAVEFSSPMNRIMELIGSHSPIIVLSSQSQTDSSSANSVTSEPSNERLQQQSQGNSESAALAEFVAAQQQQQHKQTSGAATQLTTPTDSRQHWTLLDPSQMIVASPSGQALMAAQQQQQQQSGTSPFETQYYLTTASVPNSGPQVILPGNLGFNPLSSYQPMNPTYSPMTAAHNQYQQLIDAQQATALFQQQQQPQAQQQEDRTQPIFLSSYVPEIPVQQSAVKSAEQSSHGSLAPVATTGITDQRPNSIQQVQYAQVNAQEKPAAPASEQSSKGTSEIGAGGSGDDSEEDGKSDEPDEPISNGGDMEEPNKIKRSHASKPQGDSSNEQHENSDGQPESGSMSYENKFDSDKDEQPRSSLKSTRETSEVGRDRQSTSASNGLISVGLNDDCMQCICRASSGCDDLLRCITRGTDEKYCGPFQLTEEYWNMAGSPGDAANNFISFEDCANDIDCAVETVTNYMKKYHKDCDGDESITCVDYARLHKLKPNECDNTDKLVNGFDAYWSKFQRCAEMYNRTRNGDDEDI